ncbi:uncharacterized protein LOC129946041 isoform X2 [Eupeodes corollae]|uniref:uncharacterized protein LOC129946041 isoform X2 n=1 Tax=Eupeodes corollae TaxID=290404 RepID=UPI00249297C1|nr:uncharacterized protein LOC129946041 isoform X2 [Eupeodes corollae]
MHWIFFHQPVITQDVNEETTNDSEIFNNISRSKNRLLKSISPYRLNDENLVELAPLLPFLVILTILFLLLLAVSFQRWPGLVAGVVAGCLTSLTVYLIMSTLAGDIPLYE